ncbi:MAG: hypothetical protein ACI959_000338 [Limisphaerales bacterium]|jgi:hypothetical protein
MHQTKLIRQLAILNSAEWRKFLSMTRSSFYCSNTELASFIEVLHNFRDNWESPQLEKHIFYEQFLPGSKFVARKLFDLRNAAVKLLEELWIRQNIEAREARTALDLANTFAQKGLIKDFESQGREVDSLITSNNSENLLISYQLEKLRDGLFGQQNTRLIDRSLQKRMDLLDEYYLIEKLRGSCEMLNRNRILQEPYELKLIGTLRNEINQADYLEKPRIKLWQGVYNLLLQDEGQQPFNLLIEDFEANTSELSNREIKEIYAYAQNYCIRKANAGHEDWLLNLFELYKQGLRKEILIEENKVSESTFKNIVTVALRLKEFNWAKEFIEQYTKLIPSNSRKNAATYNMANYHYAMGKHEKAMVLLREVEFNDVFYDLGAKTMLLKIYFEEEEYELLKSIVAAFRIYLKRNKTISAAQKTAYRNLINLTLQLASVKNKLAYQSKEKSENSISRIRETLDAGKPIMNISWAKIKFKEVELKLKN